MISVEYIFDNSKSLLTITFNSVVMSYMKTKCDDYLNFYKSLYKNNCFTIFKADTGYRIIRVPNKKKTYQIQVRNKIEGLKEFENRECIYYVKKNGFIKIVL